MKRTQTERLQILSPGQLELVDKACRTVARQHQKNGASKNVAFLSFLNVFATSLALVNAASLKAWHAAFQLLNKRALAGDAEASEVVRDLSLVLEAAARAARPDDDGGAALDV